MMTARLTGALTFPKSILISIRNARFVARSLFIMFLRYDIDYQRESELLVRELGYSYDVVCIGKNRCFAGWMSVYYFNNPFGVTVGVNSSEKSNVLKQREGERVILGIIYSMSWLTILQKR